MAHAILVGQGFMATVLISAGVWKLGHSTSPSLTRVVLGSRLRHLGALEIIVGLALLAPAPVNAAASAAASVLFGAFFLFALKWAIDGRDGDCGCGALSPTHSAGWMHVIWAGVGAIVALGSATALALGNTGARSVTIFDEPMSIVLVGAGTAVAVVSATLGQIRANAAVMEEHHRLLLVGEVAGAGRGHHHD